MDKQGSGTIGHPPTHLISFESRPTLPSLTSCPETEDNNFEDYFNRSTLNNKYISQTQQHLLREG